MPDERAGLAGVEIEAEPEGCEQGKELAHHKVHLGRENEGEKGDERGRKRGGGKRHRRESEKEDEEQQERTKTKCCYSTQLEGN